MGWYQWAVEMVRGAAPPVFLIAVQLEPYVDVGCFSLSAADLLEGRGVAQTLLKQLADCRKSGRWPGLMEGSIAELPVNWSRSDENADAQA